MTVAVAGVDCRELFTLLTTFFGQGTAFAEDPFAFLDGAPKVRDPLDLTDTDSKDDPAGGDTGSQASTSTTATTGAPAVAPKTPRVKSKGKVQYQDKVADIAQAKGFLPVDSSTLHNTGIPVSHHVKHSGASGKGRSLYVCSYPNECSAIPYSADIASTASHVRKHHLGHCIVCPYCGTRYYNVNGWQDHMGSKHAPMLWYGSQVSPMAPLWAEGFPAGSTAASEVTVTVPTPAPADLAEEAPKATTDAGEEEGSEEIEEAAQDLPTGVPVSGIDQFPTKELRGFMEILPSDLRQYEYFGGGSWMGRRKRDDPISRIIAARMAQEVQEAQPAEAADVPGNQEEEDEAVPSSQTPSGTPKRRYVMYEEEHYMKKWKGDSEGAPPTE